MSRELAIRVPSEIGDWVRQQPGSATETVLALAKDAWQRRRDVALRDPGAGEERLKIRLEPRVLQFIRRATHSRDTTVALRKLLRWGFEGGTLPASPSCSQPLPSAPPRPVDSPRALAIATSRVLARPAWMNYRNAITPEEQAEYIEFMRANIGRSGQTFMSPARPGPENVPEASPGLLVRCLAKLPESWLPWLCVAAFWGSLWVLRRIPAVGKSALPVGGAAVVVPKITAWTPQVASGLGALFL